MACKVPPLTDHGSEILVLGIIAIGVMILAGMAIRADNAGEASAWTAVLMAIIGAIKDRWQGRSVDRMGASLANSPPAEPPSGEPK